MYYTQPSAFGPAVAGQYRSGIGPRRSGIGSGGLRHARIGIKNKSNDNKTTLVAFLTFLFLGGGICASGKFALANISTQNTSADGRELSWWRLCRRWWHRRLSKWCRGWRQGGTVAILCLPVSKLSPGNTLHVLSQYTWQYITKFRWSMWLPNISLKSKQVRISQSMLNLNIWFHILKIKACFHCIHQARNLFYYSMMTSSNGNIFRATGPLRGKSTDQLWIPLTKASDA